MNLDGPIQQVEFAALVGVSESAVSGLIGNGTLKRGQSARQWIAAYIGRLREQAAGRAGAGGELDLVQERAGLAREQRVRYELQNAVTRGEYAPIGLLADVLAAASAAISDRLDALSPLLRKACPDLSSAAHTAIGNVLAQARNEWVNSTSELVIRRLDALSEVEARPGDDDELSDQFEQA